MSLGPKTLDSDGDGSILSTVVEVCDDGIDNNCDGNIDDQTGVKLKDPTQDGGCSTSSSPFGRPGNIAVWLRGGIQTPPQLTSC